MLKVKLFTLKLSAVTALLITSTSVLAGAPGTITFTGGAANVPTLSGVMLVILSLLLFAVALRVGKQRNSGMNKLFVTLLGVSALTLGSGGVKLINETQAGGIVGIPVALGTFLFDPGTKMGSATLFAEQDVTFVNGTTELISITGVTPPTNTTCTVGLGSVLPLCEQSSTLAPNAECSIYCTNAALSDSRLKKDINYLTTLTNGLKLYSFKYNDKYKQAKDETYVGVMAQDLLEDANFKDSVILKDNYYAVYYNRLGLKMITLDEWQSAPNNINKL